MSHIVVEGEPPQTEDLRELVTLAIQELKHARRAIKGSQHQLNHLEHAVYLAGIALRQGRSIADQLSRLWVCLDTVKMDPQDHRALARAANLNWDQPQTQKLIHDAASAYTFLTSEGLL